MIATKKRLRIFYCSLLIYLFFLVPSVVNAAPSDVVSGRSFDYGDAWGQYHYLGKTSAMSDGNLLTGLSFANNTGVTFAWTVLDVPTQISGYSSKHNGGNVGTHYFVLRLYDSNKTQLYLALMDGTNTTVNFSPVNDVKYVAVEYRYAYTYYSATFYDLKVFGEYVDLTPPSKPLGLTLTSLTDNIRLQWTANPENDIAGYDVFASDGTKINTSLITATSYEFSSAPEVSSTYYIKAVDNSGNVSLASDSVTGFSYPPATAPTVKVSNLSYTSLTLNWDQVGQTYTVLKDGVSLGDINTNTFNVSSLESETTYVLTVVSHSYGRDTSTDITVKTLKFPDTEIPVIFSNLITSNSFRLNWTGGSAPYSIYKDDQQLGTSGLNYYTVSNLTVQSTASYKISYTDMYGRLVFSEPLSVTTLENPPPVSKPPESVAAPPAITNNPALDQASGKLLEGVRDTKDQGVSLMAVIIGAIVLVLGAFFLIRIMKRNMIRGVSSKTGSAAGSASSGSKSPATKKGATVPPVTPQSKSIQAHFKTSKPKKPHYRRISNYEKSSFYRKRRLQ